ncbi:WbqC family protein [Mesonia aquimarina]|uniref:WbqC family protein n=1 Tax=Mesonia aquimarina TaxID=1504967 RepID=UPI000EF60523|nr:WbqC family protein [Mesonia aquimarina]
MEKLLVHPAYFGSIHQFSAISQTQKLIFENEDNYQKQTYRTRQYIYGANGKLLLNIPIKHNKQKKTHQKYRDVRIENSFLWQLNHWRSLEAAYRTSPFFEFYEDEIKPLYEKRFSFLLDFNLTCFETISACLQLDKDFSKTEEYQTPEEVDQQVTDYRNLIDAKKEVEFQQEKYTQVFEEKFGFIKNLSVLDLLFNEGPNSLNYLEQQSL